VTNGPRLHGRLAAEGGHFANVHVDFYEGTPQRPLRHLGGQVVPLIWSGRTATARWTPSGETGLRPVFARARYFSSAEKHWDNNTLTAWAPARLGQFARFLPSIPLRGNSLVDAVLPRPTTSTTRRRARA
jgi:hypothetical protein